MTNNSEEFETKPSSNKDMWLFLIVLDVIFLCVCGFFLYKHFSGQLFNTTPTPAPVVAEEQVAEVTPTEELTVTETTVPEELTPEVVTVAEEPVPVVTPVVEPEIEPVVQTPAPVQPVVQENKESVLVTPTTGKYRRVTFRWFGEGDKVSVVSGFTMSKPQALKKVGDHWETTLSIAPGTYKFLYIIDGKNTLDPYSPQKDGRSLLEVK